MAAKIRLEGFKECEKALRELGKAAGTATLKRALAKAAAPIAERARQLVPVDEGDLKRSIAVRASKRNPVGRAEYAGVLHSGGSKAEAVSAMRDARRGAKNGSYAEVEVGTFGAPHAHLVEFGTIKMPAEPFMRPAWSSEKQRALDSMAGTLRDEIQKTAARQARKAARVAGKL